MRKCNFDGLRAKYMCPNCKKATLESVTGNVPEWNDLCVCKNCGKEFLAEPKGDGAMGFKKDDLYNEGSWLY